MRNYAIIWLLPLLLVVCQSPYQLVRTGPEHPALPKETEVSIVPWSDVDKYDQIALVEVGEFTLERRIRRAREAARQAGGEFIAPKLPADPMKKSGNEYIIQSFVVLKKKAPAPEPVVEEKMPLVSSGAGLPLASVDEPADLARRGDGLFQSAQGQLPHAPQGVQNPPGRKIPGIALPGKICQGSPGTGRGGGEEQSSSHAFQRFREDECSAHRAQKHA